MVQGDVVIFDDAIEYLLTGSPDCPFDLGATPDTIKVAIINDTITPSTTTADPAWGAGGTTNLSTNEESGDQYPVGGKTIGSVVVSIVGGVPQLDMADPTTWAQGGANPTVCHWGVVYSDTASNKNCLAYVDLGGLFDATTGDLTITWGAPFMTADQ